MDILKAFVGINRPTSMQCLTVLCSGAVSCSPTRRLTLTEPFLKLSDGHLQLIHCHNPCSCCSCCSCCCCCCWWWWSSSSSSSSSSSCWWFHVNLVCSSLKMGCGTMTLRDFHMFRQNDRVRVRVLALGVEKTSPTSHHQPTAATHWGWMPWTLLLNDIKRDYRLEFVA